MFCSGGPLQTVQGAEFREVIHATQAADAVHLGVDGVEFSPLELVNDGDFIAMVREMIERRGEGTVRITEVKGHAGEDMVRGEQVRELDREGNNRADDAADFGRRRVGLGLLMLVGISLVSAGAGIPLFRSPHRFRSYLPNCCEQ